MDQATQQNAALVEESAAAAQSLRDQAQQLVQAVAVFKLDGAAPVVAAAVARPVAVAKPRAGVPVRRPAPAARPAAPAAAPTPVAIAVAAGEDDWESF